MPQSKRPKQQGIQSIEIGNRLLVALAAVSHPIMLRDLAATARMPASKAHRYLVSLARAGLVEQSSDSGRYDLGPFALELGLAALGRLDAVTVAAQAMRELADQLAQTVALAVWANQGATIVRWIGVDAPVSATLRLGSVLSLSRSATGRTFVAFQPEARWGALLKKELAANARTGEGPASWAELESALVAVRRRGFAYTSEFVAGISGMAAPVTGADGAMALALVTLGYSAAFEPHRTKISEALLRCAERISERLGRRSAASA
jgi:DNA-binding IclR family transcriptional regulator